MIGIISRGWHEGAITLREAQWWLPTSDLVWTVILNSVPDLADGQLQFPPPGPFTTQTRLAPSSADCQMCTLRVKMQSNVSGHNALHPFECVSGLHQVLEQSNLWTALVRSATKFGKWLNPRHLRTRLAPSGLWDIWTDLCVGLCALCVVDIVRLPDTFHSSREGKVTRSVCWASCAELLCTCR